MMEATSEARQDEFEAGRQRLPLSANPYPLGTHLRAAWEEGWRRGEEEEAEDPGDGGSPDIPSNQGP